MKYMIRILAPIALALSVSACSTQRYASRPQMPSGVASRSTPAPALQSSPTPIGPPRPGRPLKVPLAWDYDPAQYGVTEYRVYASQLADQWQSVTATPASSGTTFDFIAPQGGTWRWAVTAVRPPDPAQGETDPVESDPSNEVRATLRGFPPAPVNARHNR